MKAAESTTKWIAFGPALAAITSILNRKVEMTSNLNPLKRMSLKDLNLIGN